MKNFIDKFSDKIINTLLDSVSNGIIITDHEGNILWVNKSFTEITGYSFQEAIGKNPRILKSEHHEESFYKEMWDTISSGNSWSNSFINKRKNGTLFFQETIINPIKNGKISHYIAIIQDVTAKKHTEKELKNNYNLFKTLFYSSPIPAGIININNKLILKSNNEWDKLFSCYYNNFIKNKQIKNLVEEIVENNEIVTKQISLSQKGCENIECIMTGKIIDYKDHACVILLCLDTTKQNQIKKELLLSEYKYKKLFEQMPDGFVIYNPIKNKNGQIEDYKYQQANTSFFEQAHLDSSIINNTVKNVVPELENQLFYVFNQIMNDEKPRKFSYKYADKILNIVSYKTSENEIACISKDITDEIKHQQELIKLSQDLKSAYDDLEDFIYIASHDLKEPLRKIKLFSDILRQNYVDNKCDICDKNISSNQYIEYLNQESNKMVNLIEDLLEFSKTKRQQIKKERIDISECISDAKKVLVSKIKEKNVKIKVNIEKKYNYSFYGDKTLITHVFQNLIGNAIKFNDGSPFINIYCEEIEGRKIIKVKDNGIGIEEQYKNKIFEPLKKLHNSNKFQGSGIGLSICKKIIEKHGGQIWVEPNPDKGSCFSFTIGEYQNDEQKNNIS